MAVTRKKLTEHIYFHSRSSLKSVRLLAKEGANLEGPRMLFGEYIPEGCLIHFPSPRGVGKSWLCMQFCIAIAGEWQNFLGEPVGLHGNTLYINNELSEKVIKRRAKKLMDHAPFELSENYKAMVYTSRNDLLTDLPNIVQIIEKVRPVLVVIDNFRMAFTETDTNNNKEITRLMFTLLAFCEGSKASVLITDHFRKHTSSMLSDSDLQTGSGIKTDLSDGDFFLRKSCQDKNLRILKIGKSRHFEEAETAKLIKLNAQTMWFELVEEDVNEAEHVGVGVIKDKGEQKDIALLLREKGKSYSQIGQILGKSKATICRWMKADEEKNEENSLAN